MRSEDTAGNLELQLQREVASFDFFSLALDENRDVRDTAYLLIFVCVITDFNITEELAAMRSMKGKMTGSDLFTEDVESKKMLPSSTSDTKHPECCGPVVTIKTRSLTDQLLESLLLHLSDLDRGLVSQSIMKDSNPDLLLTTGLTMPRYLLQGHHELPSAHVREVTNESLLLHRCIPGTCDSVCPAGCPDISLRVNRDVISLPSSPHRKWRGRKSPGSLPCSPLLGERRSFPTTPSALSRQWVEAALQRSKNPPQTVTRQVSRENHNQLDVVEIKLSDMEGEDEAEDGQWRSESFRYCLLTPCICCRCPSAPPYEDSNTSSSNHQMFSQVSTHLGSAHQMIGVDGDHDTGITPQLGQYSKVYPGLGRWGITGDSQLWPEAGWRMSWRQPKDTSVVACSPAGCQAEELNWGNAAASL